MNPGRHHPDRHRPERDLLDALTLAVDDLGVMLERVGWFGTIIVAGWAFWLGAGVVIGGSDELVGPSYELLRLVAALAHVPVWWWGVPPLLLGLGIGSNVVLPPRWRRLVDRFTRQRVVAWCFTWLAGWAFLWWLGFVLSWAFMDGRWTPVPSYLGLLLMCILGAAGWHSSVRLRMRLRTLRSLVGPAEVTPTATRRDPQADSEP